MELKDSTFTYNIKSGNRENNRIRIYMGNLLYTYNLLLNLTEKIYQLLLITLLVSFFDLNKSHFLY